MDDFKDFFYIISPGKKLFSGDIMICKAVWKKGAYKCKEHTGKCRHMYAHIRTKN